MSALFGASTPGGVSPFFSFGRIKGTIGRVWGLDPRYSKGIGCLSCGCRCLDWQPVVSSLEMNRRHCVCDCAGEGQSCGFSRAETGVKYSINNPEQVTFFLAFVPNLL